jgi:hypothetical protein
MTDIQNFCDRNSVTHNPFITSVDAVNSSNFPRSVWTARRRLLPSGVRNHVAVKPRHKEARIGFGLQHLIQNDALWSRVIFSRTKKFFNRPPMAD